MRREFILLSGLFAVSLPARAENVDIRAHYTETAVSNLHRMLAVYEAIETDHGQPTGLKLTVCGTIAPDAKPVGDAHLYLASVGGHIAITRQGDCRITVPEQQSLKAQNPNVMAALSPGETIVFSGQVELPLAPQERLPVSELRRWARKLDDRISAKAGFIASAFVPNTRKAIIMVGAGASLSIENGARLRPLVINKGSERYPYTLDLRSLKTDATLVSDRSIPEVSLEVPVPLGEWKR